MKHIVIKWRALLSPERFTTFVMMLIIWTGVAGALFAGFSADMKNREYLRGRAQTIADTIAISDVELLKGSEQDLASLPFDNVQGALERVRQNNKDLSYVYLLGNRQGNGLSYFVSSEPQNSPTYITPGTEVEEKNAAISTIFTTAEAFVSGPVENTRGRWMTAYAPIMDPLKNTVIAIIAIETPVFTYFGKIALYASVPLLLSIIPFAGLLRDMKIRSKQKELLALKNQFVSISSHELRSPLTGMLWAIQSLSRSGASRLNLEQLSMLGAMYHSVESSLATVNEILDFSIFDRGQAKIQREPTDIAAVIKQVVATLSLSAREKRLIIEPVGEWPRGIYTKGDVAALKRAFMNIFSNGIKYSHDSGSIEITYEKGEDEHIIAIRDHGIGIPKAELSKVMDGYYRATNATEIEIHGTGLGVFVTKKIIEQHGGRLWINSHLGNGTDVFIALPAIAKPEKKSTQDRDKKESTNQVRPESDASVPQGQDLSSKDTL